MKNLKLLSVFAFAAVVAVSCVRNGADQGGAANTGKSSAYMAVKVEMKAVTRASSENPGDESESEVHTLYFLTFDDSEQIVGVPGSTAYYNLIEDPDGEPEAVKVSTDATRMIIIANPGPALLATIDALQTGSTFADLNEAISNETVASIAGGITPGFTMINAGDQSDLTAGDVLDDPFMYISDHVVPVTTTEAAAKAEAEQNRMMVQIERLAVKLTVDTAPTVTVMTGGSFEFVDWTLDAVNGTYYPFAEKTMGGTAHMPANYLFNFYTHDPNFEDNVGISYAMIVTSSYEAVLAHDYIWLPAGEAEYCIENTMDAEAQLVQNATRVVIRALYSPAGFVPGADWFSFGGVNYPTLADLQLAYLNAPVGSNIRVACDDFFLRVANYLTARGIPLDAPDFSQLTDADLANVSNGGDVVKGAIDDPVIRWYQGGVNYYRYAIRHDNEADGFMAFGKYGVVRNNQYVLTLTSVGGAGTPWFPDINNPGPGDPLPTDPLDIEAGFLGIEVGLANWVLWDTGFGV